MAGRIRTIPHEAVPLCGSFEVRFPDGRPSQYFYWDDIPGRRLHPDRTDKATALKAAQALAWAEQELFAIRLAFPFRGKKRPGLSSSRAHS